MSTGVRAFDLVSGDHIFGEVSVAESLFVGDRCSQESKNYLESPGHLYPLQHQTLTVPPRRVLSYEGTILGRLLPIVSMMQATDAKRVHSRAITEGNLKRPDQKEENNHKLRLDS